VFLINKKNCVKYIPLFFVQSYNGFRGFERDYRFRLACARVQQANFFFFIFTSKICVSLASNFERIMSNFEKINKTVNAALADRNYGEKQFVKNFLGNYRETTEDFQHCLTPSQFLLLCTYFAHSGIVFESWERCKLPTLNDCLDEFFRKGGSSGASTSAGKNDCSRESLKRWRNYYIRQLLAREAKEAEQQEEELERKKKDKDRRFRIRDKSLKQVLAFLTSHNDCIKKILF